MACCPKYAAEQSQYRCEKYQIYMCDGCLKCKDPELYCKFRSSCMIHFLEKEHGSGTKE